MEARVPVEADCQLRKITTLEWRAAKHQSNAQQSFTVQFTRTNQTRREQDLDHADVFVAIQRHPNSQLKTAATKPNSTKASVRPSKVPIVYARNSRSPTAYEDNSVQRTSSPCAAYEPGHGEDQSLGHVPEADTGQHSIDLLQNKPGGHRHGLWQVASDTFAAEQEPPSGPATDVATSL
jgi:hypothetical protein